MTKISGGVLKSPCLQQKLHVDQVIANDGDEDNSYQKINDVILIKHTKMYQKCKPQLKPSTLEWLLSEEHLMQQVMLYRQTEDKKSHHFPRSH